MDFITSLPVTESGNNAILTTIDRLTKQAHFVPIKTTANAVDTADINMRSVFRLHGLSKSICFGSRPSFHVAGVQQYFQEARSGPEIEYCKPPTDGWVNGKSSPDN